MSYLDDLTTTGSITCIHFDTKAVPFSSDWITVAKVTIDVYYVCTYELRGSTWCGSAWSGVDERKVKDAIDVAWSKHLADIMTRDESGASS